MELAIYHQSEPQAWKKRGNYNTWDFPLVMAFDERLLPFTSRIRPTKKGTESKTFILRRLQIINGNKQTVEDFTIDPAELRRASGTSGDYFYFLADKAFQNIVAAWSSPDDLISSIYEYRFAITLRGASEPFLYYSDIFCYGAKLLTVPVKSAVGAVDSGDFDKKDFNKSDFRM